MSIDANSANRVLDEVHRSINQLGHVMETVQDSVSSVASEVGNVRSDLSSTRGELQELRQRFDDYVLQAERTAAVQRSETVLGNLEAELEREYGHYKQVRRSSIGTLQAFDIGNVTNRTVQQVSEELMIQTPRYWLAPALVALAAWSRDDQDLADKSVGAAFSRDPAKTGLFFALVLRRQGRAEAATRWLKHYLDSLDPRALTREFAAILEATAQDAFGAFGRELVAEQLVEWNALLRADPAVGAKQVEVWTDELRIHRGVLDEDLYPHLSKTTPQWGELKDLLEHASAHRNASAKFTGVRDTRVALTADVSDRLDDILEILVTEYDEEELPYARQVIYHKAVIDSNGDLERAKETADALSTALDETLDLVTMQTQIALRPEMLGSSVGTQQVAIGIGREDFGKALAAYDAGYRRRYLNQVDIVLDPQHSSFAINLGFPGWQTNTSVPQEEGERALAATWAQAMANHLERVRFKPMTALWPAIGALVATFIGFLIAPMAGVVLLLLVGGGAAGYVFWKKKEADKAYNDALGMQEQAMHFSVDVYRAAIAEYVDATIAYREEDELSSSLNDLIKTWPTTVGHRRAEAGAQR